MSERDASRPVNLPGAETSADPERTLTTPSFDDNSIHAARAAVPLASADARARRTWSLPLVALAVLAGVIGGGVGILAINLYQKRAATQTTQANTRNVDAQNNSARANTDAPSNSTAAPVAPITSDTTSAPKESQAATEESGAGGVNAGQASRGAGGEKVSELRAALGGWIDATNARDIDRQMNFYDAKLDAFYLAREASRDAVREEKARVFSRASTVEVRADEPQIDLGADGQTATMRFRKQFNIEGGGGDKHGAVLQELRWRRTPAGWKITSERDLRVVN